MRRLPPTASWRSITELEGVHATRIVAAGAVCRVADVDAAVAMLLRACGTAEATIVFLEHVGRTGVTGWAHRALDPMWASFPLGCHVDHDVPAALRRAGFLITDLERFTMPTGVPLLRPWVQGTAVLKP